MSNLRVFLADDEPLAIDRLCSFFADIPGVEIVGTADNGDDAASDIVLLKPDLAILDIQMPGQTGLRVTTSLPPEGRPEIVFVTAFEHYAADAFVVEAADYILKPVRFDRLWQAVERARRRHYLRSLESKALEADEASSADEQIEQPHPHEDGFWVQNRSGANYVPISTIDWIEAQRDYVMLHTATRSHIIRFSMRAIEQRFDAKHLVRVHRSAFARLSEVVEVQRMGKTINALVLRDGAIVQVGPNYAKAVSEKLLLG